MAGSADFSGYATKAGLKCSDGLTIMPNAFKEQDGERVPLVWHHGVHSPENILGHAILENRADGVYAKCFFNDSPAAQSAKEAVKHEDINSLSIYANNLIKKTKAVVHGVIREVSLVVAGANPGAKIDNIAVAHADGETEILLDEAIIFTGLSLSHSDEGSEADGEEDLSHADDDESIEDVFNSLNEKQKKVANHLIGAALAGPSATHSDSDDVVLSHATDDDETIGDVFATLTEKQKNVVTYLIAQALETATSESSAEHSDIDVNAPDEGEEPPSEEDKTEDADGTDAQNDAGDDNVDDNNVGDDKVTHQEGNEMTHNVFETDKTKKAAGYELKHSDVEEIFQSAKRLGTVKDAVEAFALSHGIDDIETLFPDAKAISNTPELLARRMEWVNDVMTNVRNTPFSRIKSLYADLTLDDARAKGYIKGNVKREEFFKVAKRVTGPQTVYKKQKLDRDDILDITDFDVVAWLKAELRIMLEEEVARAILFGDGRSIGDDDKISEDNIRSIANDHELYATTIWVNVDDSNSSPEEIVDAMILQRYHYRGSGNPTFYTKETILARMLNVKDELGRRIYSTMDELAATLRVRRIVPVEAMEVETDLIGIMVNLIDYNVGADRGGQTTMFEDFDIDVNQQKYLLETRFSGALVKPKSAIVVRATAAADVLVTPNVPTEDANVVTVGTQTGVVWTATGATGPVTITAGAFTLTSANSPVTAQATPASGYYFPNTEDSWMFEYEA